MIHTYSLVKEAACRRNQYTYGASALFHAHVSLPTGPHIRPSHGLTPDAASGLQCGPAVTLGALAAFFDGISPVELPKAGKAAAMSR